MNEFKKRLISSIILLVFIYLSLTNLIFLFLLLFFIIFISLIELNQIYRELFKKNKIYNLIIFFVSLIYLYIFSLTVWIYLNPLNIKSSISLLLILLICSLSDIGGYCFGKIIGGKKLIAISPNKTYSGVIGSFIFPSVFCYLFYKYFNELFTFEINIMILILLVSLISQLGDLFFSFLKRKVKIKDTGRVLPGHGGLLDRIDGILFGLPIGIFLISI